MKTLFAYTFLILSVCLLTACQSEPKDTTSKAGKNTCRVLSQADFEKLLSKTPNPQLVDVRTSQEFSEGSIKEARNIDFYSDKFLERFNGEIDKTKPVFIYCRSGGRSGKAGKKLLDAGYSEIYDLEGGYSAWSKR